VNKFIIIILIIIPTIVCSQTFDLGLTMGINTSQVSGDGLGGYNKLGIRIGGLIRKEFSQFNAQIELQYINKGSSRNSPNDSYIDSYSLLITVPLFKLIFKSSPYTPFKDALSILLCS
jgi:hypothetical protein